MSHTAYLGLGSNLNNPRLQLLRACQHINQHRDCELLQVAPLYRSKAWGVTNQPDFYNTAISVSTRLSPLALLKAMKTIEYKVMGRVHNKKWHARVIDIDILLYDRMQMMRPELQIPHPWIQDRSFVFTPLLTLNPPLPASLRHALNNQQGLQHHKLDADLQKTPW